VKVQSLEPLEENVTKVVDATSSEVFLSFLVSWAPFPLILCVWFYDCGQYLLVVIFATSVQCHFELSTTWCLEFWIVSSVFIPVLSPCRLATANAQLVDIVWTRSYLGR